MVPAEASRLNTTRDHRLPQHGLMNISERFWTLTQAQIDDSAVMRSKLARSAGNLDLLAARVNQPASGSLQSPVWSFAAVAR